MWAWVSEQWAEVYQDNDRAITTTKLYRTVDSRICKDSLALQPKDVHATKPSWVPSSPTGTQIVITIERTVQAKISYKRSRITPEAIWHEIDDVERLTVVAATVTDVKGYDGATHRCGWCEEYSAINPDPRAPCKGCNRTDWVEWVPETVVVGPLSNPQR